MSTATPPTSQPDPFSAPVPLGAPPGSRIGSAPSAMMEEGPMFARGIAFAGLFFLFLGVAAVIAKRATGTERLICEGMGLMFAALGLALLLFHATTDRSQDVRRGYGAFAAFWLVVGVIFALVPGPFEGATKTTGYYLVQYGVPAGLLSLLFGLQFVRHETDEKYRFPAMAGLLAVGGLLVVGSTIAGIVNPDYLAGPGLALALLGLGFLCAYLGQVDTSDGIGYLVAFALGAFGALLVVYALGRAIVPSILYEGPAALRKADQSLDRWKVAGRALVILLFLGLVAYAAAGRLPLWLRASL